MAEVDLLHNDRREAGEEQNVTKISFLRLFMLSFFRFRSPRSLFSSGVQHHIATVQINDVDLSQSYGKLLRVGRAENLTENGSICSTSAALSATASAQHAA